MLRTTSSTGSGMTRDGGANTRPGEGRTDPIRGDGGGGGEEGIERIIALWVDGRSPRTVRAYLDSVRRFVRFTGGKPLDQVTLTDLVDWKASLEHAGLAPASVALHTCAIKSLLAWVHRAGLLPVNVGAALRVPLKRSRLAERILPETAVHRMLVVTTAPRDRALLLLLYGGALRVSEALGLCWRDCAPREDGRGQVTVWGKGGKERTVVVPAATWSAVLALRPPSAGPDDPVFATRTGRRMLPTQAWRIVRRAARRAGMNAPVSAHWLRHAHASHALDHGAPIHLVQATLGHASLTTTGRYLHARPDASSSAYLLVV